MGLFFFKDVKKKRKSSCLFIRGIIEVDEGCDFFALFQNWWEIKLVFIFLYLIFKFRLS